MALVYSQLHEKLIECQELTAMASHLVRAEGSGSKNAALADGWHALSEMLKRVDWQITQLATRRLN